MAVKRGWDAPDPTVSIAELTLFLFAIFNQAIWGIRDYAMYRMWLAGAHPFKAVGLDERGALDLLAGPNWLCWLAVRYAELVVATRGALEHVRRVDIEIRPHRRALEPRPAELQPLPGFQKARHYRRPQDSQRWNCERGQVRSGDSSIHSAVSIKRLNVSTFNFSFRVNCKLCVAESPKRREGRFKVTREFMFSICSMSR